MNADVLFLGPRHAHSKKMRIILWILIGLLALQLLVAAGFKLAGTQESKDNFERWGYPDWFRLVVGAGEVLATILLFLPQTRFWAAGGIVLEMIGAVITHVRIQEYAMVGAPVMLLVLAAAIAWLDRPERLRRPRAAPTPAPT